MNSLTISFENPDDFRIVRISENPGQSRGSKKILVNDILVNPRGKKGRGQKKRGKIQKSWSIPRIEKKSWSMKSWSRFYTMPVTRVIYKDFYITFLYKILYNYHSEESDFYIKKTYIITSIFI